MDIIGFQELLLIAFVALLVIGPERLPETLRTLGLWFGRLRRSFTSVKNEIEKEIGMDEIRRQLHNEAVLDEMKRIEQEVQNSLSAEPGQHNSIDPTIEQSGGEVEPTAEPDADTPAVANLATAADPGDDAAPADAAPADATPADTAPETTPLPRSEAELEALHQRKRRQQLRKES